MKTVTTHHAKTHLSQLIREVQGGETITILKGSVPVATLTAAEPGDASRPHVGTVTSRPVSYDESVFVPMDSRELREWGL